MPIFEYKCLHCDLKFEYLVKSSAESVACPRCNAKELQKLVSDFSFKSKDAHENINSSSSGCSTCANHNCAGYTG